METALCSVPKDVEICSGDLHASCVLYAQEALLDPVTDGCVAEYIDKACVGHSARALDENGVRARTVERIA